MGEGRVEVVQVGVVENHPYADALALTGVNGCPVVIKLGQFAPGDVAVYVPVDTIVPDAPEWAFLGGHRRIKAKRLRGVFSMGLLTEVPASLAGALDVGDDVTDLLGMTRYSPEDRHSHGVRGPDSGAESCPFDWPVYDIEGFRKWKDVLISGEEVEVTEKLHGCNGRFVFRDGRLWVGSRNHAKREDGSCLWWQVATQYGLAEKLTRYDGFSLYGEVYGQVQDLKYGQHGVRFALFDVLNLGTREWFHVDDVCVVAADLGLERVPLLYRGPWDPSRVDEWAEGNSTIAGHVREGFVVKPVQERTHPILGRVILKMHGQGYLLRKEGKE